MPCPVEPTPGVQPACSNQTPYDIGTFGSLSIRTTGVTLRQAAAEMRQWLLELGATRFGTATDGLATRDGTVYVATQPSVSAGYGDLALGERVDRSVKGTAPLKDPSEYTIVGHNEEHLIVETAGAGKYRPGDVVYALPGHICPTVALHKEVLVAEGGKIVGKWTVASRDRVLSL